ncbi:MAG: hypothetical protein SGILL_010615, partial [Bacillariaceae sp.]
LDYDGDRPKPGFAPPYDGLGMSMVLDVPVTMPTKTIAFSFLKSYGEKWEKSAASVEILRKVGEEFNPNMEKHVLKGYHDKETSETYTEELNMKEAVAPPDSLRIKISLESGHTFKLMGIATCGGLSSTSALDGSRPGFPSQCGIKQRDAITRQLQARGCYLQPFLQECSLTKATTRGCHDPYWVREVYGTSAGLDNVPGDNDSFRAVFVNSACKSTERLADVMLMGTHDVEKYSATRFIGSRSTAEYDICKQPVSISSKALRESESICVTSNKKEMEGIARAKQAAGISDTELKEIVAEVGRPGTKRSLDDVLEEAGMSGKPIHHLVIGGNALEVLTLGANATLHHVRYLEFSRGHSDPEPLAFHEFVKETMASNDLVCYFEGRDLNIWRITDCFLPHYNQKQWSNVACVSANHDDAKPLLEKMESMFDATLKKEQSF